MTEKRKRQPNFSGNEKLELFSIIHNKYGKIIENKITDKVSTSEKELAWVNIEKDFNASSQAGLFRDQNCLKRFYENRKREVRKLKALQRQEMMKTGGGPEKKIIFDIADELLIQIMNIKTVEGLQNSFDSDKHVICMTSTDKHGTEEINDFQNNVPRTILDNGASEDNSNTILMKRFKKADDLTKPKDPALRPLYLNNNEKPTLEPSTMENNNLIILECEGNEFIQDLNLPISQTEEELVEEFIKPKNPVIIPFLNDPSRTRSADNIIGKSGEQLEENFDTGPVHPSKQRSKKPMKANKNRNKIVDTFRPRRSGIQILASSHIAKKYDALLDLRKILLDKQIEIANQDIAFQKAKQKLELELLNLKVQREKKE